MKKPRIVLVTVVITLVVVSAAAIFVRMKLSAGKLGTIVRIARPVRGSLVEYVSAPGEIEPRIKVEISAKISARIVELPYDEGDFVTAGDPSADPAVPPSVLLRLDSKDLESQLLSAKATRAAQAAQIEVEKARIASQQAGLKGLEASLHQAKRDLARQAKLLDSNDISQAAFDRIMLAAEECDSQCVAAEHTLKAGQLNLTVLGHNLEAADARIDQANEALSYMTITSPIDGVVTRINAEVGELVITGTMNNPGTVILEVGDLSQMLLVAQVDEADVAKLCEDQNAVIHIDAFGEREFKGKVDSIALAHTVSWTRTKYYRTEILIESSETGLYSGLTAHVDIETLRHEDVLKVPSQAVLGKEIDSLPFDVRENSDIVDPNKTFATVVFCYVDGKAVITPVKIGHSDLTHTIVLEGITDANDIIVGPYHVLEKLVHDEKVRDERVVEKNKKRGKSAKAKTEPNEPIDDANK